jgi:hypothetical protein
MQASRLLHEVNKYCPEIDLLFRSKTCDALQKQQTPCKITLLCVYYPRFFIFPCLIHFVACISQNAQAMFT